MNPPTNQQNDESILKAIGYIFGFILVMFAIVWLTDKTVELLSAWTRTDKLLLLIGFLLLLIAYRLERIISKLKKLNGDTF